VPLAGSSDSAITDFNPWVGIQATVTRRTVSGRELGAAERLTVAEALHSYTTGGAYALGQEASKGSLEPGKLADLVVLDRDPLAVAEDELATIRAERTMVGGEWVGGSD
jgi:hypothetical protein